MNHQIFLSIIIPCYNVKTTIRQTVASVLRQSCADFEIILVDDGSTDGSSCILEKLTLQDKRIKLIQKFNEGVSSARNIGLLNASGEYVLFLDGDDTISSNLIKEIKGAIVQSHQYDLLLYGFDYEKWKHKSIRYTPYTTLNYIRDYLLNKLHLHISSFVARRGFIEANHISFNEQTFYSEDREYIVACLNKTSDIAVITKALFQYRYNQASAMHVQDYTTKRSSSLDAMERVYKSLKSSSLEDSALASLKMTIILHWRLFFKSSYHDNILYEKLEQYSKKYLYKINSILPLSPVSLVALVLGYLYRFRLLFKIILSI